MKFALPSYAILTKTSWVIFVSGFWAPTNYIFSDFLGATTKEISKSPHKYENFKLLTEWHDRPGRLAEMFSEKANGY